MRDRFDLPLSDSDLEEMRFYRPDADSKELQYLRDCRIALGGNLPARRMGSRTIAVPPLLPLSQFAVEADGKEMSTTMALVRIFNGLLRDKELASVSCRSWPTNTYLRPWTTCSVKLASTPRRASSTNTAKDAGSMLFYRERKTATPRGRHQRSGGARVVDRCGDVVQRARRANVAFYIFYSMFGFQRVGDLIWAAADQRHAISHPAPPRPQRRLVARPAAPRRSSHVVAATVPNCRPTIRRTPTRLLRSSITVLVRC